MNLWDAPPSASLSFGGDLYHGTHPGRVDALLDEGFVLDPPHTDSRVWLTDSLLLAAQYGTPVLCRFLRPVTLWVADWSTDLADEIRAHDTNLGGVCVRYESGEWSRLTGTERAAVVTIRDPKIIRPVGEVVVE
jgi:hypothetical protein